MQTYINDFIKSIKNRENERSKGQNKVTLKPTYPIVLLFFGNRSIETSNMIISEIKRFWRNEFNLVTIGVTDNKEFIRLLDEKLLDEKDAIDYIRSASVYNAENSFEDYGTTFIYSILDTSDYRDVKDLDDWKRFKEKIERSVLNHFVENIEIILLDINNAVSSTIKDHIANEVIENDSLILLLSNELKNHAIISRTSQEWHYIERLIAGYIVVSNREGFLSDAHGANARIATAGFTLYERPYRQISISIIGALLEWVKNQQTKMITQGKCNPKELIKAIRNSENINTIIKEFSDKIQPDDNILQMFPRKGRITNDELIELKASAKKFNECSMNVLPLYLDRRIQEMENASQEIPRDFHAIFKESIKSYSTIYEVRQMCEYLSNNHWNGLIESIVDINQSVEEYVHSYAKNRFLSQERYINEFSKALLELKEENDEYIAYLIKMRVDDSSVNEDVLAYYKHIFDLYVEEHESSMQSSFKTIHSKEEFSIWMKSTLDQLSKFQDYFSCSFEQEVQRRNAYRGKDISFEELVSTLNKFMPFYSIFNLSSMLCYTLMDTDCAIKNQIMSHLDQGQNSTLNTGIDSFIEVIDIYPLKPEHLVRIEI